MVCLAVFRQLGSTIESAEPYQTIISPSDLWMNWAGAISSLPYRAGAEKPAPPISFGFFFSSRTVLHVHWSVGRRARTKRRGVIPGFGTRASAEAYPRDLRSCCYDDCSACPLSAYYKLFGLFQLRARLVSKKFRAQISGSVYNTN